MHIKENILHLHVFRLATLIESDKLMSLFKPRVPHDPHTACVLQNTIDIYCTGHKEVLHESELLLIHVSICAIDHMIHEESRSPLPIVSSASENLSDQSRWFCLKRCKVKGIKNGVNIEKPQGVSEVLAQAWSKVQERKFKINIYRWHEHIPLIIQTLMMSREASQDV